MDKTCGNCSNGLIIGGERMQCLIEKTLPDGCAPLHFKSDAACDKWEEEPLDLKQRFEKLEQVALEMYDWLDGVVNRNYAFVPERLHDFKRQLRELGVIEDDQRD